MVEVRITERASDVLTKLSQHYSRLVVRIDEQGCCTFSNVFVTEAPEDEAGWVKIAEADGIPFLVSEKYRKYIGEKLVLDAVESPADDSFSLETQMGVRFITVGWVPPQVMVND